MSSELGAYPKWIAVAAHDREPIMAFTSGFWAFLGISIRRVKKSKTTRKYVYEKKPMSKNVHRSY
jgi:hypothetical protein